MAEIKIEKVHGPARRAIGKGLRAFNEGALGKFKFEPVSVTLRHRGEIVGGVVGEMYLGWMFIALFWVADEFRNRGFGSKLMRAAESEARKRGVKNVYVDTFSFQAPAFYEKHGFREFGRLNDFPEGHHRSWMTKVL